MFSWVYVYVCVCVCVCTYVRTYVCMYVLEYIYTYVHNIILYPYNRGYSVECRRYHSNMVVQYGISDEAKLLLVGHQPYHISPFIAFLYVCMYVNVINIL